MPYSASIIAYAFVKKGIDEGIPVTQMKLQKLVYFAQGIHLAFYNKPLVYETFQAWQFGPVIPKIYQQYKYYKDKPITDTQWLFWPGLKDADLSILDEEAKKTIDITWKALKNANAVKLSNWTHKEGSPWHIHYVKGVSDIDIPNEEIERYFKKNIVTENATS